MGSLCIPPKHSLTEVKWPVLSWFQTSQPVTALLLHCLISACHFKVAALSSHAALAFSPGGIALKLNRSQLSAICCCKQSGEDIDDWLDAAYRLVLPLRQVALARLNKYHHQSSELV